MPAIGSVYQNFIRQGLSKTVTHGYAQSVVAATHPHVGLNTHRRSSFARRHNQRVGTTLSSLQLQTAFQPTSSSTALHEYRREKGSGGAGSGNGSLDAYFEALQKRQLERSENEDGDVEAEDKEAVAREKEKEWTQFQFPKPIEWKPEVASIFEDAPVDSQAVAGEEIVGEYVLADVQQEESPDLALASESEIGLAQIDAALEQELEVRKLKDALDEHVVDDRVDGLDVGSASGPLVNKSSPSRPVTPAVNAINSAVVTPTTGFSASRSIPTSPVIDAQSRSYADHLTKLSLDKRYAEILAVFEAMLVAEIKPTATAYNALLTAAASISRDGSQVVTKALDIYADMMRRGVLPDSETYNILVGVLASRSLEVGKLKKALDDRCARFGGVHGKGKFIFSSSELEYAMLAEDDRLDHALRLFDASVEYRKANYPPQTYHQLIKACAAAGHAEDMLRVFEHMENNGVTPLAATFPPMIKAYAENGNIAKVVGCYDEYRDLAVAHDSGKYTLIDRLDSEVYAAVAYAYIVCDRMPGAMRFYKRIIATNAETNAETNDGRVAKLKDDIIRMGFVKGLTDRGLYEQAMRWAQEVGHSQTMAALAIAAADAGDKQTATAAFAQISPNSGGIVPAAMTLMALCVRTHDMGAATHYWQHLFQLETEALAAMIEPTIMYALGMMASGQVMQGLVESETTFQRIRATAEANRSRDQHIQGAEVADQLEEAVGVISEYMASRGITDPRLEPVPAPRVGFAPQQPTFAASANYPPTPMLTPTSALSFEDSHYDPHAHNIDYRGSSIISNELEGAHNRRGPGISGIMNRLYDMRQSGRHPRYITYAKLISAIAARERNLDKCREILVMARTDVPLLTQYAAVRYGWSSILDAMVAACLNLGDRQAAEMHHQELLNMGAAPSANTYGLYITTPKESSHKTFDEATEAVNIFHRAKSEGVAPSSFLYNAVIGKLGRARRVDDCLFYFGEMRNMGIKATSVTYGTVINALVRVSNDRLALEYFAEMESMPNYRPRPAPYNSVMQFFLSNKHDKETFLKFYARMCQRGIQPTAHTYKLLIEAHATLEPVDIAAAENVLDEIRRQGGAPEAVHYAALISAKGCALHDLPAARRIFDTVLADRTVQPCPALYQALLEVMVAHHRVVDSEPVLLDMRRRRVEMTPYIANTLIRGWAAEKDIAKAERVYQGVRREKREPSTYEAMTRAYLAVAMKEKARGVVREMLGRGYPGAVTGKVVELVGAE